MSSSYAERKETHIEWQLLRKGSPRVGVRLKLAWVPYVERYLLTNHCDKFSLLERATAEFPDLSASDAIKLLLATYNMERNDKIEMLLNAVEMPLPRKLRFPLIKPYVFSKERKSHD